MFAVLCGCERSAALQTAARRLRRTLVLPAAGTIAAPEETRGQTRFRFAPSPTGSLHVGGARTALYNWLAARKLGENGKFLIRIEDTDLARSTRESEDSMLADLEWLGLNWDEGPRVGGPCGLYRQSERGEIYTAAAQRLVESGDAYPCFSTEADLEEARAAAMAKGVQAPSYDGAWRDADKDVVAAKLAAGEAHTFRFRTQPGSTVAIQDLIRGRVEWDVEATIGDFILLRSNGVPVYNFCVAVDDAMMGVHTVVRAEEHLTNTVRQLLVLQALGFRAPEYAHASLILGSDRSKLSKRHGATSCGQFRDRGYLPDAMINYLALLGWNDGTDKEVYTRQELIDAFDIERVIPSPAMFDDAKLRWINGQHLRAMESAKLAPLVQEAMVKAGLLTADAGEASAAFVDAATRMAQPKAELVVDITQLALDALAYPLLETVAAPDKKLKALLDDSFADFAIAVADSHARGAMPVSCYADAGDAVDAQQTFAGWLAELGTETGRDKKRLFMPVRLALTGRASGPEVEAQLETLALAGTAAFATDVRVPLVERIAALKQWALDGAPAAAEGAAAAPKKGSVAVAAPLTLEAFTKLRPIYEANRRKIEDDEQMYAVLVQEHEKLVRKNALPGGRPQAA